MKTNYVLIDFENVRPDNLELLDQEWIRVLLFVGKNQTKLPVKIVTGIQRLGSRAQYVEMCGTGHNALDFHIAYYIGKLAAEDKGAYFHIVSGDQGFDPLVEHLKNEKVFVARVKAIAEIKAIIQASMSAKTPEERIAFAKERLIHPNTQRPRSRKTLTNHVGTMFAKLLSPEELDAVVEGLLADGCVRVNGKRVEYADEGLSSD